MTSYLQSGSVITKQILIAPGDNVAIEINGQHYPIDFVNNGGVINGFFQNNIVVLENFGNSLGSAIQFSLPIAGITRKLNILVHEFGTGAQVYRLITWSIY
jgi:hypothetical protein